MKSFADPLAQAEIDLLRDKVRGLSPAPFRSIEAVEAVAANLCRPMIDAFDQTRRDGEELTALRAEVKHLRREIDSLRAERYAEATGANLNSDERFAGMERRPNTPEESDV